MRVRKEDNADPKVRILRENNVLGTADELQEENGK